jgi:hypothetical protein
MKPKSILFVWMLLSASVVFHSCKDDDDNNNEDDPKPSGLTDNISAKWEISDPNSRYISFEFNKDGNYIVVERAATQRAAAATCTENRMASETNAPFLAYTEENALRASQGDDFITHFGTYTVQNGQTLLLSGFGVFAIISITENELSFSVTLTGQTQAMQYNATKTEDSIAASTKTDLLCRTWLLVKLQGVPLPAGSEQIMLISRAGTYFYKANDGSSRLSQWKWYDYPGIEKESVIAYSHDGWLTGGAAVISSLTENALTLTDSAGILYEFTLAAK